MRRARAIAIPENELLVEARCMKREFLLTQAQDRYGSKAITPAYEFEDEEEGVCQSLMIWDSHSS